MPPGCFKCLTMTGRWKEFSVLHKKSNFSLVIFTGSGEQSGIRFKAHTIYNSVI